MKVQFEDYLKKPFSWIDTEVEIFQVYSHVVLISEKTTEKINQIFKNHSLRNVPSNFILYLHKKYHIDNISYKFEYDDVFIKLDHLVICVHLR